MALFPMDNCPRRCKLMSQDISGLNRIFNPLWRYVVRKIHHYVIMSAMASQITGVSIICSIACSSTDKRQHQSSASLAFVGESIGDRWIQLTKGQWLEKCFHLMTSSCNFYVRPWASHKVPNGQIKLRTSQDRDTDIVHPRLRIWILGYC